MQLTGICWNSVLEVAFWVKSGLAPFSTRSATFSEASDFGTQWNSIFLLLFSASLHLEEQEGTGRLEKQIWSWFLWTIVRCFMHCFSDSSPFLSLLSSSFLRPASRSLITLPGRADKEARGDFLAFSAFWRAGPSHFSSLVKA